MNLITEKQKHFLRGLAHKLKPVVMIGNNGVTDSVVAELQKALAHHELLKVRISGADRDDRDAMVVLLCEQTGSTLVQRIGNIAVLFLRNPKKPRIILPK